MHILLETIDRLGGIASRRQLVAWGVSPDMIDVAAYYGRQIVRVRKGWYALIGEDPEMVRAWRVGGRLTCVSALAFHEGAKAPPALHLEVKANAAHLRDPDNFRRPLGPDAPVVLHWARHPGPGGTGVVTAEHATAVAAVCGVRSGQAAVSSASASRIV